MQIFYKALVVNNDSKKGDRRIQVRVLGVHPFESEVDYPNVPDEVLPWARIAPPMNGSYSGEFFKVPKNNEWVWVFFEDEGFQQPIYFAYVSADTDVDPDFKPNENEIVTNRYNGQKTVVTEKYQSNTTNGNGFVLSTSEKKAGLTNNSVSIVLNNDSVQHYVGCDEDESQQSMVYGNHLLDCYQSMLKNLKESFEKFKKDCEESKISKIDEAIIEAAPASAELSAGTSPVTGTYRVPNTIQAVNAKLSAISKAIENLYNALIGEDTTDKDWESFKDDDIQKNGNDDRYKKSLTEVRKNLYKTLNNDSQFLPSNKNMSFIMSNNDGELSDKQKKLLSATAGADIEMNENDFADSKEKLKNLDDDVITAIIKQTLIHEGGWNGNDSGSCTYRGLRQYNNPNWAGWAIIYGYAFEKFTDKNGIHPSPDLVKNDLKYFTIKERNNAPWTEDAIKKEFGTLINLFTPFGYTATDVKKLTTLWHQLNGSKPKNEGQWVAIHGTVIPSGKNCPRDGNIGEGEDKKLYDLVIEQYKLNYFAKSYAPELLKVSPGIAAMLFDMSVQHGTGGQQKIVESVCGGGASELISYIRKKGVKQTMIDLSLQRQYYFKGNQVRCKASYNSGLIVENTYNGTSIA